MEAMFSIAAKYGMTIEEYHYSEAQDGKDQRDREGASMKEHARIYVKADRSHKITNAMEFKAGIMYRGGPKRCKVAVISMDTQAQMMNIKNLKEITKFHSFKFEKNGYRVLRYYQIGPGKLIKYSDTTFVSNPVIESDFDDRIRDESMVHRPSLPLNNHYYCDEDCSEFLETGEEFLTHKMNGKHTNIAVKRTSDVVKLIYRDLASSSVNELSPLPLETNNSEANVHQVSFFKRGWALPKRWEGAWTLRLKNFG